MFDIGFPRDWSSLKKLIWLKAAISGGGASGIWKTVTGTLLHVTDALASPMQKCEVTLEPIQDLHGQDAPYPAGGSAQLLPTYLQDQTLNGVTLKVNADGSVTINGKATATTTFDAPNSTWQWDGTEDCWLSGCPQGGDLSSTYSLRIEAPTVSPTYFSNYDVGSGCRLASYYGDISNKQLCFRIVIRSGTVCNNLVFKPMLNKGLSAQPFQPYENICPITGWTGCEVTRTGKNLYSREESLYNVPVYATDGTSASYPDVAVWWIKAKPNTKYTVSGKPSTRTYYIRVIDCDENKGFIYRHGTVTYASIPLTVTTHTNTGWLQIAVNQYPTDQISNNDWQVQIKEGDSAEQDEYEPYFGTTLSVTFPDGQTVYGGTVDLVSGVLTVDRANVDMGTLNYAYYGSSNPPYYRSATIPQMKAGVSGVIANALSSMYEVIATSVISTLTKTGLLFVATDKSIFLRNNNYTDAATFKTAMSGVQLVYELAEPIEIQLTPQEISTLAGENNIWGDGTITAIYKATE